MSVFQLSLHVFRTDLPRLVAIESPDHISPNDEDGRAGHVAWKRPVVEEDVLAACGSHRDQHPARPAVGAQT